MVSAPYTHVHPLIPFIGTKPVKWQLPNEGYKRCKTAGENYRQPNICMMGVLF